MFKTTVVSLLFAAILLSFLQACALSTIQLTSDPVKAVRHALSQDLIDLVELSVPNKAVPLFIHTDTEHAWLHESLNEEATKRGYTLDVQSPTGVQIDITLRSLGADVFLGSVAVEDGEAEERIYHLTNAHSNTGESVVPQKIEIEEPRESSFVDQTKVQLKDFPSDPESGVKNFQVDNTKDVVAPITQPIVASATPCLAPTLQPGSLKQNLDQILRSCGWRIASWPADPTRANHELDWIVSKSINLQSTSIEEIVASLTRFGIHAELNRQAKSVRMSIRD